MKEPVVRIIHMNNGLVIKFDYNQEIVKMMRSFQARYQSDKSWTLEKSKLRDLLEEMEFQGIKVYQVGEDQYTVKREE